MKKLFLLAALFFVAATFSSCEHKTLTIKTPGTLSQLLTDYEKNKITELTIIGNLNDKDIATLNNLTRLAILDMENANLEVLPNYAFYEKKSLTSVKLPKTLKTIGEWTFGYCSNLTDVTIPNSVTEIRSYAFVDCKKLTSVTIPDSVTVIGERAFCNCCSLTSITISDGVATIGDYAFSYCSSLTSITIPDSVTTIGNYAFENCNSLTSITIPGSVTSIGINAFYVCSGLTAFYGKFASSDNRCLIVDGCLNSFAPAGLTSYTIPDGVTTIGDMAFALCCDLTNITIPDGVTTIGNMAFFACSGLTNVTIPDSVTTIGDYTFSDCSSLTSITIPGSVTSIGVQAFGNSDLISITIGSSAPIDSPDKKPLTITVETPGTLSQELADYDKSAITELTVIGDLDAEDMSMLIYLPNLAVLDMEHVNLEMEMLPYEAFRVKKSLISVKLPKKLMLIGKNTFWGCSSLKSITIPNGIPTIAGNAFYGCCSLTSITIPDSVTSIGNSAFEYCTSLTNVTIGNSVTTIGDSTFSYCSSLTNITIGRGVTSIKESAFYGCKNLKNMYCKAQKPPKVEDNAFDDIGATATLYVPIGSKAAYATANGWKYFRIIETQF